MSLFDLSGKTAIITGAGRGIGRSIALGLADAGSQVVICSRTTEELEEVAEEIKRKNREVEIVPCDITIPSDIDRVVERAKERFGKIDILINNAGITVKKPAEEYTVDDWNKIIAVNLTGVFLFAQKVGIEMLAQQQGTIINISSIASKTAITNSIAYGASKGGVNMITKTLASEWATRGVRVNGIAPAYIETPLVKNIKDTKPEFVENIEQRTPMNRLGKPDEIVGAAVFLSSEASSYMTGETIFVDGGWTAIGM
ncbi:hypothetical protein BTR23_08255 [Alkalihalophilus pseudofirmus]|nr:hypothetical protein BTR23_08255 [Alkalihalophilus pseudofirmus]